MGRIALTGATGFVGRRVLKELLSRGLDVVVLARTLPEEPDRLNEVEWHQVDVHESSRGLLRRIGSPERLLHLAWGHLDDFRSEAHFSKELPAHYRFLEGLIEDGLGGLTVAGTCLEYGMTCGALVEDTITAPTLAYPFAKDALRKQLQFLQARVPFQFSWARLFYMFGEGQSSKALKSQLTAAVARGDAVFDMSGGEQLRDYLPIAEVARRLVAVALHTPAAGIVNVCSGAPRSVRGLVDEWIHEMQAPIRPNLGRYPYPGYEPMAFWGDDTKLQSILGGAPMQSKKND